MPKPHPSKEDQNEWMARCVPVVLKDGTAKDQKQAVAICLSMWKETIESKAEDNSERETRISSIDLAIESRASGQRKIVGHAAVFDSPTLIGGMFREQVAKGAFIRAIREDDVRALIDHDPSLILGRKKAGTLRLQEDTIGLRVEIDPPDTQAGRDIMISLERGDITGMSFGFMTRKQEWDESSNPPLRTLRDVELLDVSVVTYPAYPETDVALRSLEAERRAKNDLAAKERQERRRLRQKMAELTMKTSPQKSVASGRRPLGAESSNPSQGKGS